MDWPELKATVKLDPCGTVLLGVNENKYDITDIVVPENVEEIADSALAHCCHLKSVSLPLGLRKIGKCAFVECIYLENIVISDDLKESREYSNFSQSYSNLKFQSYPSGTLVTFTLTMISTSSFLITFFRLDDIFTSMFLVTKSFNSDSMTCVNPSNL